MKHRKIAVTKDLIVRFMEVGCDAVDPVNPERVAILDVRESPTIPQAIEVLVAKEEEVPGGWLQYGAPSRALALAWSEATQWNPIFKRRE